MESFSYSWVLRDVHDLSSFWPNWKILRLSILFLLCLLSVLYQQFRVFLTPAFLPLILASPLGVSCVFAKETKTIGFAAGWVCLCFLHAVCSPAPCYLKAVFKVTLGGTRDTSGWNTDSAPNATKSPSKKVTPIPILPITSRSRSQFEDNWLLTPL